MVFAAILLLLLWRGSDHPPGGLRPARGVCVCPTIADSANREFRLRDWYAT